MRKEDNVKRCRACGTEMPAHAKFCPLCGEKNKKSIFKRWWFWLIILLLLIAAVSGGDDGNEAGKEPDTPPSAASEENGEAGPEEQEAETEESPDIPLSTDFEKAVWEIVKDHDGRLISIESLDSEDPGETTVIAAILCENDEETVNAILADIAAQITSNDTQESGIFNFGDIEEGDDGPILVMAGIYADGTIDVTPMSGDYNSARNRWIQEQFSAWDGAHYQLQALIIQNLNDEKSYDHIETLYRDVSDESTRDEINQILADAGYSQRVELGDLFIQTEFSAKNAFGGTIKSMAYGISSYNNNTITLIAIE